MKIQNTGRTAHRATAIRLLARRASEDFFVFRRVPRSRVGLTRYWRDGLGLALLSVVFLGSFVCFGSSVFADGPTSKPSLDDLLNLAQPSTSGKTAPKASDNPSNGVKIDPEVARKLAGEDASETFHKAVQDMYEVSERIGKQQDPGDDTQRMQKEILAKLDRVIAAAQQQQSSSSSSSSSDSSGDARDADAGSKDNAGQESGGSKSGKPGDKKQGDGKDGKDGQGKPGADKNQGKSNPAKTAGTTGGGGAGAGNSENTLLHETRDQWGKLPPRLRDQLLEGLSEQVSPVYKEMTESYYRRLAEEGGK